jgi:protein phosphatase 1G
MVGLIIF